MKPTAVGIAFFGFALTACTSMINTTESLGVDFYTPVPESELDPTVAAAYAAQQADPLSDNLCIRHGSPYLRLIQIHGECPVGADVVPILEGPPDMMGVAE